MSGLALRQSTSVVLSIGPFVDKTDAVTLKTGLVSALDHASTGLMLSKNGGTLAVRSATVTASTYDAHGSYKITLSATDTNTLGTLRLIYTDAATCLPVWADLMVLPPQVWDSLYGSDLLQVDARELGGTTQTARDVGASVLLSNGTGAGQVKLSGGYVAPNWGDVGNPTTAVGLSATTISTGQTITSVTGTVGTVNALAANTVTAAALAADAVTEIQAGLSTLTPAQVNAEADTALADVGLTSTVTGRIDATVSSRSTPAQILTTALVEAYAADGVAPTLSQLLFLLLGALTEFSISGTTIAVKKLDGTTTAATYTLNDGTNPTSRTRAT